MKFASLAWTIARDGLFYLRFPEPGTVPPEDEQYFGRIYFHRLGDSQSGDVLVFGRPDARGRRAVGRCHRRRPFLVVTAQRGASDDSEIHFIDLSRPGDFSRTTRSSPASTRPTRSSTRLTDASSSEPPGMRRTAGSLPCDADAAGRAVRGGRRHDHRTGCRPRCWRATRSWRRICRTRATGWRCSTRRAAPQARSLCRASDR